MFALRCHNPSQQLFRRLQCAMLVHPSSNLVARDAKYQGIRIQKMMLHLARCEDGETAVHQQSQPCPVSKDRCTGHHQPTTRSSHGGRPPVRRFARATIRVRRFARATIRHGGGPPVQRFARLTIQAPPPCTARPFDTGESRPCGDSSQRRLRPPPCTTRPFDTGVGRPCDDSPVQRFRPSPLHNGEGGGPAPGATSPSRSARGEAMPVWRAKHQGRSRRGESPCATIRADPLRRLKRQGRATNQAVPGQRLQDVRRGGRPRPCGEPNVKAIRRGGGVARATIRVDTLLRLKRQVGGSARGEAPPPGQQLQAVRRGGRLPVRRFGRTPRVNSNDKWAVRRGERPRPRQRLQAVRRWGRPCPYDEPNVKAVR